MRRASSLVRAFRNSISSRWTTLDAVLFPRSRTSDKSSPEKEKSLLRYRFTSRRLRRHGTSDSDSSAGDQ